jgi:hypothetical protein
VFTTPLGVAAFEYAGVTGCGALDGLPHMACALPAPNLTSPPIGTSSAGLLLAMFSDVNGYNDYMEAGAGWTLRHADSEYYYIVEDRVTQQAGTYQASATDPGNKGGLGAIAAFKAR